MEVGLTVRTGCVHLWEVFLFQLVCVSRFCKMKNALRVRGVCVCVVIRHALNCVVCDVGVSERKGCRKQTTWLNDMKV